MTRLGRKEDFLPRGAVADKIFYAFFIGLLLSFFSLVILLGEDVGFGDACIGDSSAVPFRDRETNARSVIERYVVDVYPQRNGSLLVTLHLTYRVTEGTKTFGFKQFMPPNRQQSYVSWVRAVDDEGKALRTRVTCDGDYVEIGWELNKRLEAGDRTTIVVTFEFVKAVIDTGSENLISLPNAGRFRGSVENASYAVHLPQGVSVIEAPASFSVINNTYLASLSGLTDPPTLTVVRFVRYTDEDAEMRNSISSRLGRALFSFTRPFLFFFLELDAVLVVAFIVVLMYKIRHLLDEGAHHYFEVSEEALLSIPLSVHAYIAHGEEIAFWAAIYSAKFRERAKKSGMKVGGNRRPWLHELLVASVDEKDLPHVKDRFKSVLVDELKKKHLFRKKRHYVDYFWAVIGFILGSLVLFMPQMAAFFISRAAVLVVLAPWVSRTCYQGKDLQQRFTKFLQQKIREDPRNEFIEYLPLIGLDSASKLEKALSEDLSHLSTHPLIQLSLEVLTEVEETMRSSLGEQRIIGGILDLSFKTSRSSSTGCDGCGGCGGCSGCGGCGGCGD